MRWTEISLLHPRRSNCFACGSPIAWFDNLPILSYLWLHGRCRGCGANIGLRTLIVEFLTPVAALGVFALWGWSLPSAAVWLLSSCLIVAGAMRLEGRPQPHVLRIVGWLALSLSVAMLVFPWRH